MKITLCMSVALLALCATGTDAQGVLEKIAANGALFQPKVHIDLRQNLHSMNAGKTRRISVNTETRANCPEGFVRFRDSCFSQSLAPASWESARVVCKGRGLGGDLASINSKEELDFIHGQFRGGKNELRWIGLHKESSGTPYKWANRDTVRYLHWASNYTGEEPTGYVALNLANLHFLPQTNPEKFLPFLCGTRRVSGTATAAAVDFIHVDQPVTGGIKDVKTHVKEREIDAREDPVELQTTCSEGWESFEGRCYKAFNEKRSYEDARANCKKVGANLMSLHSPKESEFVRQEVIINNSPDERYWLGLSNGENGLQWSDDSPFDFNNWPPGIAITSPKRKLATKEEDNEAHLKSCYYIGLKDLKWDSADCDGLLKFCCASDGTLARMPIPERVSTTIPAPNVRTTVRTSNQMELPIIDMREQAKKDLLKAPEHNTKPKDPLVEFWDELMKVIDDAGNLDPPINISTITRDLLNSDALKVKQNSEANGDSNQNPAVTIMVVMIGSGVLVVAALGVISWIRQRGRLATPWTTLQNSSTYENIVQSARQYLRDPENSGVIQQGIYGAME